MNYCPRCGKITDQEACPECEELTVGLKEEGDDSEKT